MTTRVIPDNCADGLDDILDLCAEMRKDWKPASDRADKLDDTILISRLSKLRHAMAEIERKAGNARKNIYKQ